RGSWGKIREKGAGRDASRCGSVEKWGNRRWARARSPFTSSTTAQPNRLGLPPADLTPARAGDSLGFSPWGSGFSRRGAEPMTRRKRKVTRRSFLRGAAAASAVFTIVPRHVLGGPGHTPPSDTFGGALIGCGGRGAGTFLDMSGGLSVRLLARCDVKYLDRADNKEVYTDFP